MATTHLFHSSSSSREEKIKKRKEEKEEEKEGVGAEVLKKEGRGPNWNRYLYSFSTLSGVDKRRKKEGKE